jgi:solute carrier family 25 (mitochondrial oxoglutarate transporter), member 11
MSNKSTPKAPAPTTSTLMNFTTAGLGGMIGWCVVHPFNTVAVRMSLTTMSQPAGKPTLSFPNFFLSNVKQHGILNLYNGLSAGILRQVFYASTRFGLFEVMRDEYKERFGSVDLMGRLGCGIASGSIAAFVSCPAEVTLVRLSNDATLPKEQQRNYGGVMNAFTRILKEEGVSAFFRGKHKSGSGSGSGNGNGSDVLFWSV